MPLVIGTLTESPGTASNCPGPVSEYLERADTIGKFYQNRDFDSINLSYPSLFQSGTRCLPSGPAHKTPCRRPPEYKWLRLFVNTMQQPALRVGRSQRSQAREENVSMDTRGLVAATNDGKGDDDNCCWLDRLRLILAVGCP